MVKFACIASVLILFLSGLPARSQAEDAKKTRVVLKGLDPVSLVEGQEVAGSEDFATTRGRFVYRFASAEHKALFDSKPEQYAVQGEMCTVMPKVAASGDLFSVHDRKIFLFGSPRCQARFREEPSAFVKPALKKNVAILIYDGMELLDFAGPGEVFGLASNGRAFEVFTVSATSEPVKSQGFVAITPTYTFESCPKPDILVVPGGSTRITLADPTTVDWVRKTSKEAEITLSVCTGALILAKAGLLDGLEATTHHESLIALKQAAPKSTVVEGRRFVDNGRLITSAGVSSGIDASLHLVERLLGSEAATEAAKVMEYRWEVGGPSEKR